MAADKEEADSKGDAPSGEAPPTQEDEEEKGAAKLEGDAVATEDATKPGEEGEDDQEFEKYMKHFYKALGRIGMMDKAGMDALYRSESEDKKAEKLTKSEDKEIEAELAKSDDEPEDEEIDLGALVKSAAQDAVSQIADNRLNKMEETMASMAGMLEKMSRQPARGRKSVDGLRPLRKSLGEDDSQVPTLNKMQVCEQLIKQQRDGDKRVTPQLVAQYEMTGNYELVKDIVN